MPQQHGGNNENNNINITVENLIQALSQYPKHFVVVTEREVMSLAVAPPGHRFDDKGDYLEGCEPVRIFRYVVVEKPDAPKAVAVVAHTPRAS
jgi:hypothetical protein